MNNNLRVFLDLLLVTITSIIFTLFSISYHFIHKIDELLHTLTKFPVTEFAINAILLLLMGLLWISYRQWRKASQRQRKLEHILTTKSEVITEKILDHTPDGIIITDSSGFIIKVNHYLVQMLGYQEGELIGKHVSEIFLREKGKYTAITGDPIEITDELLCDKERILSQLWEKGEAKNIRCYFICKNGMLIPVEQNISVFHDEKGNVEGGVGILRDITEQIKAEKEIKEVKDYLENIFKTSADGILVTDHNGFITLCNKEAENILGYAPGELIGKQTKDLTHADNQNAGIEFMIKLRRNGAVRGLERTWSKKNGSPVIIELNAALLKDKDGKFTGAVSSFRDITERKKVEKEIREAKEFMENIFQTSADAIVITDATGNITMVNAAVERIFGHSRQELIGKHSSIFIPPDKHLRTKIKQSIEKLFRKGRCYGYETTYQKKNGQPILVECNQSLMKDGEGNIIGSVNIIRDISEKKELESKLFQSEKLKSLGELAGGVAHDFNNLLAAIMGRIQLLKMNFELPPGIQEKRKSTRDIKRELELMEKATRDGAETVRRIQEFARRREDDKCYIPVDINALIDDSLEFTKSRWKDEAEARCVTFKIDKEFSPLPCVEGSASELREVFTNLINNALDAMPEGGTITIKTHKEGPQVVIEFEDTGTGIPDEIRNRVFEPFFTTKGPRSTGLGLSVSYGIIDRHRGSIRVDSIKGKGARFTIKLPSLDGTKKKGEKPTNSLDMKKAKILLIEDEEDVREVLAAMLIEGGHEVEAASDGMEGVELFKKKGFDLVITDLGMPGVSGWQVAEKVKVLDKSVPVIIVTGWNLKLDESEMRARNVDMIIKKPFEVEQIFRLVQEGILLRNRFNATMG